MCSDRIKDVPSQTSPAKQTRHADKHLLRHPGLWRARDARFATGGTIATGFAVLDEILPGGGWPASALVEILHDVSGIGELSLLLPALSALSSGDRVVACIAPPHELCVPALSAHGVPPSRMLLVEDCVRCEALWAGEQALRSGACGAVLLWPEHKRVMPGAGRRQGATQRADGGHTRATSIELPKALRRLQLAAETGNSLGVIFRNLDSAAQASPAPLRLALYPDPDDKMSPCLEILKSRGGRRRRLALAGLGITRSRE